MASIELWLIDLTLAADALERLEEATPRLDEALKEPLPIGHASSSRRDRRLTHIALRILLERKLGPEVRSVPFVRSRSGKPSLHAYPDLNFSLAHTRGIALVGISDKGFVGVDVETTRSIRMLAARRAPIEAEAIRLANGAPLETSDADARFLRAWVRIEAVSKARGTGVGPLLEAVRPRATSGDAHGGAALNLADDGIVAHDLATAPGIFAAVALSRQVAPPPLLDFPTPLRAIAALCGD